MIQRADRLIPHRRLPHLARLPASFAFMLLIVSLLGSWTNAWRGSDVYALLVAVACFATVGAVLALISLSVIWVAGGHGTRVALGALWRAALALAPLGAVVLLSAVLPRAVDVTSNVASPIAPPSATVNYRDKTEPMAASWGPGPAPVTDLYFAAEPAAVFDALVTLVERRGWRIIRIDQPGAGSKTRRLEAEVRTPLLGLHSDLAIEVRPSGSGSVLSMRAIARYLDHDLGANTFHLKRLSATLQTIFEPLETKNEPVAPALDDAAEGLEPV